MKYFLTEHEILMRKLANFAEMIYENTLLKIQFIDVKRGWTLLILNSITEQPLMFSV